ncbi:hypothetical protein EJ02DRAFT_482327 [Clathrospora elynae]|uniref:Uncharacterized protein n=1 Tax=Clathrospora elynae TaxID=706981 RepID=A0A6A5S956_9PLEO|nr:hypothetical protein EJ02DRAFT_482327 [Clathrospora elynae]
MRDVLRFMKPASLPSAFSPRIPRSLPALALNCMQALRKEVVLPSTRIAKMGNLLHSTVHYQHKYTDIGHGIYYTSGACSAAAHHLAEDKPGHRIAAPNKPPIIEKVSVISVLIDGTLPVSQAVANKLGGFSIQRFRLAAVGWLIENNHPISEFESLAF